MIDFSKYELSDKYYGGSEKKLAISIDGFEYMLKFQKQVSFSRRFNHISEYLGSHIFELLGFNVQDTYLGTYKGEEVVACKNFMADGESQFVPFNDVGESSLEQDKETYQYSYEDIMRMLRENMKLTDVPETVSLFWDMYVVDALLGNFDRHGSNWGFIKKNNKYSLAPIFDNGSCLFPQMTDENKMKQIMSSEEETNQRIYKFPTSQVKLNGNKSSYYEVINSFLFEECNASVITIYEKYSQEKVNGLIDSTPFITETHKQFYKYMLDQRFKKIIVPAYNHLKENG